MQTYITRQEIADKLGLTVPMVSQAIANKVIPVDHHKGMVPRTWFNASKLTAAKIYEQTLEKQTKNTTTWGIIFLTASLIIGTLIATQ